MPRQGRRQKIKKILKNPLTIPVASRIIKYAGSRKERERTASKRPPPFAKQNRLRNCVRVARQTLTLFVRVRILLPQPTFAPRKRGAFLFEVWLSLVERYVRDVEVAGSNPVTSTNQKVRKIAWECGFSDFLFFRNSRLVACLWLILEIYLTKSRFFFQTRFPVLLRLQRRHSEIHAHIYSMSSTFGYALVGWKLFLHQLPD